MKKYTAIGLGGTFDHFHEGHKTFLTHAAAYASKLFVGVTTDAFIQNKKPFSELIEPFETRKQSVATFCQRNDIDCHVFALENVFGPTLEDSKVDALCVTEETKPNAHIINQKRKELNLAELPIEVAPFFLDQSGKPLHSVAIRAGKSSRTGTNYELILNTTLELTNTGRAFLSRPLGEIINQAPEYPKNMPICAVGDTTLEYFIQHNLPYTLGIFDFHQKRAEVISEVLQEVEPDISATNPAGAISLHLTQTLKIALQQHLKHIFVQGEEDLATAALILLLPLNSRIYYGQPDHGLVEVIVTESLKNKTYQALSPNT